MQAKSAGLVFEDEKRFDLVVRLDSASREQIQDVKIWFIATKSGVQIPLSHIANVELKLGPNQIQREDTKRRIVVGFNIRAKDVQSVVSDLQKKKVESNLQFPPGYRHLWRII